MPYNSAVIYSRFSNERKDDSLDAQTRQLQEFADRLGIPVAAVIAEDDVSAWTTSETRKGRWPEVVEGLKTGKYDCLIVRELARTWRDMVETIRLAQLRDEYGFGFYALNGDKLDDELMAAIIGWKNARSSKDTSDRLKLKFVDMASKGKYNAGHWAPYGYHWDKTTKQLTIVPTEAEVVREITQRLISGESTQSLAVDLDARRIPSKTGSVWSRHTIARMIRPTHAGLVPHLGVGHPGQHQAIISVEEYEQVRAVLQDRSQKGHNTRRHLLAGLVVCGRCGFTMTCNGRGYGCSKQRTKGTARGCGGVTISKRHLEDLVVQLTIGYLGQQQLEVEQQVDELFTPDIQAAQAEIEEIHALKEAGELAVADWMRGLKAARQKLAEAEVKRSEQLAKLSGANLAKLSGDDAAMRWLSLNLSQQRAVLGELFEALVISPAKVRNSKKFDPRRVEVVWKAQDH